MFTGSNSSGTAMEDADDNERRIVISEKGGSNGSDREEPVVLKEEEAGYQPAAPAPASNAPPDGGLRAWLVVLGAWCTSFCSFGWINSMSPLPPFFCWHFIIERWDKDN